MKHLMKKANSMITAMLGLSMILLSTSANAEREDRQRGPGINHQQIVSQLSLDTATEQSLLQLMNKHRTEHKSVGRENRQSLHGMHQRHRSEVKGLLSAEQFAAFEQSMHRQRQQQPDPGRRDK